MSTAVQICSDALAQINIIRPGESVAGPEMEAAVRKFTLMLSSWKAKGVVMNIIGTVAQWQPDTFYNWGAQVANNGNLYQIIRPGTSSPSGGPTGQQEAVLQYYQYEGIVDGTATWTFIGTQGPIDPSLEQPVIDCLALRLAPDYGVPIDPGLAARAKSGWTSIQAFYISAPVADTDLALKQLPSQRRWSTVPNA